MRSERFVRLFAACALLVCLLCLKALAFTSPGYVSTYGSYVQNGAGTQVAITVYDYGDHRTGQVMITTLSGVLKGLPDRVTYAGISGKTCTDAFLSGQGTFTTRVGSVSVVTPCQYSAHVWKGTVNGLYAAWVQADVQSVDGKTLLYATGPTWPAASSTPCRMTAATLMPFIP